ncbi:MAG: arsenate reductase ArsC [Hyphomicrobium sp.]
MSVEHPLNVLFLCTHNSARSIIAESVMNRLGQGRFRGFSAGSMPSGTVHPMALEMLNRLNYDTSLLRSKSWGEFEGPAATKLDFVFTVCDNAANEVCPVWPGQPISAHWGLPDPSAVQGSDAEKHYAFAYTHRMLYQRIGVFVSLPFASLDGLALKARLREIGTGQSQVETKLTS